MAYLFAGFLALWALIFVYVFSISARQRRLERTIEGMEAATGAEPNDGGEQAKTWG